VKKIVIAGLVLLTSVAAAQARVEWRGTGKIVKLTQACIDDGWAKKIKGNLRFRPSGLSDNGDRSGFSTILSYNAFGVRLTGKFDGKLRKVDAYGISAGGWGPVKKAKFRFASIKPSTYNENTKKLKVVAEFTEYGGTPGCTMQWKGTLKKH